MSLRLAISIGIVMLFGEGCVTGTAHMLPVAGNPLRAQAEACEVACHRLLESTPTPAAACHDAMGTRTPCGQSSPDRGGYARCLDSCPGARSIDGSSCPDPPLPGLICEKTYRANAGGIIGGTVAILAVVLLLGIVVAIASAPIVIVP